MTTVYDSRTKTTSLPRVSAVGAMADWETVCPLANRSGGKKGCEGSRDSHYFERVCSKSFRDCYEGTMANEEEDK